MDYPKRILMRMYRLPYDGTRQFLDDGERSFEISDLGDGEIGRNHIVFCERNDEERFCYAMRYTQIDEDIVRIESLDDYEMIGVMDKLREKGFTEPLFDYFGVYQTGTESGNLEPPVIKDRKSRCIENFSYTMKSMIIFLKEAKFRYTANLKDKNGVIGYKMMDDPTRENDFWLMQIMPKKRKLYFSYSPGIRFNNDDNAEGHRLIEYINARINDLSIVVTESRDLNYRGFIDLTDAGASANSIRRLYECAVFISLFFGNLLKECVQWPKTETDYIKKAAELFREVKLFGEKTNDCEDEDITDFLVEYDNAYYYDDDIMGYEP